MTNLENSCGGRGVSITVWHYNTINYLGQNILHVQKIVSIVFWEKRSKVYYNTLNFKDFTSENSFDMF